MLKKLLYTLSSKGKLYQAIKNDDYNNWETHFNNYNSTAAKKADPLKLSSLGLEIYEENLKKVIADYAITDGEKEILTKIRDYFQLSDAAVNAIKSKYAQSALTNLSKQKLSDNILTEEEKLEIGLFAKELNIAEEEVNRINQKNASEILEGVVKQIISDKIVTVDEQQSLNKLAQQLGVNMRDAAIDKRTREDYYFLTLLNALDKGYLPEYGAPSIETQQDEKVSWEITSNLVATRSAALNMAHPVRMKVEKGVSYRLGSGTNWPIPGEMRSNHQGVLVITNRRVVFAASQQSFSIPFDQLNSFDAYADGIGLQRNNTELLLQFYDKQMSEVVFKVLTNAINTTLK